jgi:hypothetical protein
MLRRIILAVTLVSACAIVEDAGARSNESAVTNKQYFICNIRYVKEKDRKERDESDYRQYEIRVNLNHKTVKLTPGFGEVPAHVSDDAIRWQERLPGGPPDVIAYRLNRYTGELCRVWLDDKPAPMCGSCELLKKRF